LRVQNTTNLIAVTRSIFYRNRHRFRWTFTTRCGSTITRWQNLLPYSVASLKT